MNNEQKLWWTIAKVIFLLLFIAGIFVYMYDIHAGEIVILSLCGLYIVFWYIYIWSTYHKWKSENDTEKEIKEDKKKTFDDKLNDIVK